MEEEDYGTYCFLMESRGVEFLSLTLIPSPPTCRRPPPPASHFHQEVKSEGPRKERGEERQNERDEDNGEKKRRI